MNVYVEGGEEGLRRGGGGGGGWHSERAQGKSSNSWCKCAARDHQEEILMNTLILESGCR
jgi:hypothetical protein